jgi:hypothetical protein
MSEVFEPKPIPLPKELYEKAAKLKTKTVELVFSGGNDEGMLVINLTPNNQKLEEEFHDWAWKNYDYNFLVSGYGNGLDYEDRITYDIKKKTVSTWGFVIEKVTKRKTKYVEKQETKKEIEVQ